EVAAGSACRGARVGRKSWRKAAGVEPTRKRLTPPPGFEAQPHHRVRVPSGVSGRAPAIATQEVRIAHAARVADAIEKLQDLDGALAPSTERIAVMRGADRAVLLRQGADNGRKLRDTAGVVEEIL